MWGGVQCTRTCLLQQPCHVRAVPTRSYDVSPPGGPGVLASFLWADDALRLMDQASLGPQLALPEWGAALGALASHVGWRSER